MTFWKAVSPTALIAAGYDNEATRAKTLLEMIKVKLTGFQKDEEMDLVSSLEALVSQAPANLPDVILTELKQLLRLTTTNPDDLDVLEQAAHPTRARGLGIHLQTPRILLKPSGTFLCGMFQISKNRVGGWPLH